MSTHTLNISICIGIIIYFTSFHAQSLPYLVMLKLHIFTLDSEAISLRWMHYKYAVSGGSADVLSPHCPTTIAVAHCGLTEGDRLIHSPPLIQFAPCRRSLDYAVDLTAVSTRAFPTPSLFILCVDDSTYQPGIYIGHHAWTTVTALWLWHWSGTLLMYCFTFPDTYHVISGWYCSCRYTRSFCVLVGADACRIHFHPSSAQTM